MAYTRAWQTVEDLIDGGTYRVSYVEIDLAYSAGHQPVDIRYVPFQNEQTTRLMTDVAQTMAQFGKQAPEMRSILVVCRGKSAEHVRDRYPGSDLMTYNGSTILSADVAESAIISKGVKNGYIVVEGKRPVIHRDPSLAYECDFAAAVLERLWFEERVVYVPAGKADFRVQKPLSTRIDLVVPLNQKAGFLSREAIGSGAIAAFNAGFFVWVEEEFADPYSFATDHVGLVVVEGRVVNAPLFRRSALVFARTVHSRRSDEAVYSLALPRPAIRMVSLENYALRLAGDMVVHGTAFRPEQVRTYFGPTARGRLIADLNPAAVAPERAAFFNRLAGSGRGRSTSAHTPPARNRLELAIVGEEVCSLKEDGETFIPHNGFVLSLPCDEATPRLMDALMTPGGQRIHQALDLGDNLLHPTFGVQVGPRLVQHGRAVDIAEQISQRAEEYVPLDPAGVEPGIPPVYLTDKSQIAGKRARIGFGVRPDRRCYVVMIEGNEPRTFFPESDSAGGDAAALAECMLALGCQEAVAFDSGGSAQIIYDGKPLARVADRNDIPFTPGERIIPGGWMVFA